jgi:hypothetical protein
MGKMGKRNLQNLGGIKTEKKLQYEFGLLLSLIISYPSYPLH